MDDDAKCAFCNELDMTPRTILGTRHFFVVLSEFPVNKGHALIISKRHIPDMFSMNEDEWRELETVIVRTKMTLDRHYNPDGYNIGVNCGEAAGQTVFHLHIHLVPRYNGDVENPRGGIRNFMQGKS
jgi:diadenosine tetraphosphate (Ap4A) HIT family hydrolase